MRGNPAVSSMPSSDEPDSISSGNLSFVAGGGDMGERIRAFDWAATPIGSLAEWPRSLKTAVRIMLTSRQPIWIGWGKDLLKLYNDPYKSIIGGKHSWALGRPAKEVWQEIWPQIGPMLATAMRGDEGTYVEAQLLIMERSGYPEETYYTYSYSPVPDDQGKPGGIICANTDDTQRVIGERQLALLRELAAGGSESRTLDQVYEKTARALATNQRDLPFTLIYLAEPDGKSLSLVCWTPLEPVHSAFPKLTAINEASPWQFAEVIGEQAVRVIDNLSMRFGEAFPSGAWDRPPQQAAVVPIPARGETGRQGVLIVGLNPFRQFDAGYRSFLTLAAGEIAASLANAQAYEDERRRAEALAEVDRAKTLFFSNVSHEFRTPLTLMLSPLEEILAKPADQVFPDNRALIEVAHRNSIRLLKLVNTLLDFSRIEAGRTQAAYQPADLARLTADLASNFRSACERAGLHLVIDCPPLQQHVYVDRDMWEKIVLNLLSNAFKFTFEGEIIVRLRAVNGHAELSISDNGVGIPAHELPRLFERFHRIEGQKSRTHEGSGIGLALVQELVKLHKGTITADSAEGRGTTFTVTIPLGRSHLPADRIGEAHTFSSTAVRADAYVGEALRWLPQDTEAVLASDVASLRATRGDNRYEAPPQLQQGGRVLVADDNADMRAYICRLLAPSFDVQAVADGQAAIEAIRERAPDLVLADVMMPRLDGFGLLRALRSDPELRDIPVIMLSARAGEENRVEGLQAGADDYLVKPFSARELIARVGGRLELLRVRRSYEQQLAGDLDSMTRLQQVGSRSVREGNEFIECLQEVLDTAISIVGAERGNIQLLEPESDVLKIAVQRGFAEPFLSFFSDVRNDHAATCGAAMRAGERIVVEDVMQSDIFKGTPALGVILQAGVRAVQSILGMISTHFAAPHRPSERDLRLIDILAQQTADYLQCKRAEGARSRSEAWSAGQREAFRAAVNDVPLDESLGILIRTALDQMQGNPRCAFYIVDPGSGGLHHVVGMSKSYADDVDGFKIGADLLACGLAVHTGEPVITPDVLTDPRWKDWRWLAEEHGYRACWSFPVETSAGKIVGTFSMYYPQPRQPTARDYELVAALTPAAGMIISRHEEAEQRARTVVLLEERARELKLLTDELNHRVKNTLANVRAVAQQTMRTATEPAEFVKRFSGRLQSMARVHTLLSQSTWEGADLRELIRDQLLNGSLDETRVTAQGPAVHLEPQMAIHLAMMLHELGTNSIKYGALSAEKGWIAISWTVAGDALDLHWIERGGPGVSAPVRRGFGSMLIERSAQSEGGRAEQIFAPEGMTWKISMQLSPSARRGGVEQAPSLIRSAVPVPADASESTTPLVGLRFLVVEDESLIAMDFVDTLERFGADEARSVSTERACLDALEASTFDCTLLDANLHGHRVDGIAAALARRQIPFVFITGYGQSGLPTAFQQAPVLAKPVTEAQLLAAVAALVSEKRSSRD